MSLERDESNFVNKPVEFKMSDEWQRQWDAFTHLIDYLSNNGRQSDTILYCLGYDEAKEYMKELGISASGLDNLITASYELLNLITFITTGPEETKAWTITNGTKAPQAAGVIHTDFEQGFIRAEAIDWQLLLDDGGWNQAKDAGHMRMEGKEYIMKDGDTVHFHFN